jgi:hypothetical protein
MAVDAATMPGSCVQRGQLIGCMARRAGLRRRRPLRSVRAVASLASGFDLFVGSPSLVRMACRTGCLREQASAVRLVTNQASLMSLRRAGLLVRVTARATGGVCRRVRRNAMARGTADMAAVRRSERRLGRVAARAEHTLVRRGIEVVSLVAARAWDVARVRARVGVSDVPVAARTGARLRVRVRMRLVARGAGGLVGVRDENIRVATDARACSVRCEVVRFVAADA